MAILARASPTAAACYRCIRERWDSRPAGATTVAITFDEFATAGARRNSVPAAIDILERRALSSGAVL
jgi:hypothetical protein